MKQQKMKKPQKIKQEINHSFILAVDMTRVYNFLWEVEAFGPCIPGCEEIVEVESGKTYKTKIKRRVGPFYIRFELDIAVTESVAPSLICIEISGQDKKLRSSMVQRLTFRLSQTDGRHCKIDLATDFELSGLLCTLGEQLLTGHIYADLDNFVAALKAELEKQA